MKKKIFYTLSFALCMNLYATSKEFSATGKKEETVAEATKLAAIKEQQQNKELATGFPLIHLFHEMS